MHLIDPLVSVALQGAVLFRGKTSNVMVRTDQGSQYASKAYRALLEQYGLVQSMSRRGNCWDNAVAESFFATLKKQAVHGFELNDREQTKRSIFEYIETYYNRIRRHSTIGWLSPLKFESLCYKSLGHFYKSSFKANRLFKLWVFQTAVTFLLRNTQFSSFLSQFRPVFIGLLPRTAA